MATVIYDPHHSRTQLQEEEEKRGKDETESITNSRYCSGKDDGSSNRMIPPDNYTHGNAVSARDIPDEFTAAGGKTPIRESFLRNAILNDEAKHQAVQAEEAYNRKRRQSGMHQSEQEMYGHQHQHLHGGSFSLRPLPQDSLVAENRMLTFRRFVQDAPLSNAPDPFDADDAIKGESQNEDDEKDDDDDADEGEGSDEEVDSEDEAANKPGALKNETFRIKPDPKYNGKHL